MAEQQRLREENLLMLVSLVLRQRQMLGGMSEGTREKMLGPGAQNYPAIQYVNVPVGRRAILTSVFATSLEIRVAGWLGPTSELDANEPGDGEAGGTDGGWAVAGVAETGRPGIGVESSKPPRVGKLIFA